MEKTCFFIGHRDAPDSLAPELDALVERHITEYGVGGVLWGTTAVLTRWRQAR